MSIRQKVIVGLLALSVACQAAARKLLEKMNEQKMLDR